MKKRNSSFNENTRRPVNTLTLPKKGDNTDSISPVNSETSSIPIQKYSNEKRGNKLWIQNQILKSFRIEEGERNKIGTRNPVFLPESASKRDSSPSINSERKEFSKTRKIHQNQFDHIQGKRKSAAVHPKLESKNYLAHIPCQESLEGQNDKSQIAVRKSEKLRKKNRAIFPQDLRRNLKQNEHKEERKYNSLEKKFQFRGDLSNYNESQMNEK